MYDLITLLLTGRAPPSVREFFSSGGRLSERVRPSRCIHSSLRVKLKKITDLLGNRLYLNGSQQ